MNKIFIGGTVFAAIIALALSLNFLSSFAAEKKCPISGKPAKDGISLNVNGKEIDSVLAGAGQRKWGLSRDNQPG